MQMWEVTARWAQVQTCKGYVRWQTLGTGSDLQRLCHPGHRLSDNQAETSVISRRIYDWDGGTMDGVTHGS